MTIHTSIVARNDMLANLTTDANSGKLDIYTGSKPATPETAATGTKLVEFTLPATSFGAGSGGVITANAITAVAALATGTAGWARLWKSDGTTALMDFDVTATGGGGDITIDSTSITQNAYINITSFTITLGQ